MIGFVTKLLPQGKSFKNGDGSFIMELDELDKEDLLVLAAKCIVRLLDFDRYGSAIRNLSQAADLIVDIVKTGRASSDAMLFLESVLRDTDL
jgi:hypothetical protein